MFFKLRNKEKVLLRSILKIAFPTIVDTFAQTLLAAFDMMMVGSLGAWAISSVGVGSAAFNAIIPAMMAVGIGTSALLSRAYGAKNIEEGKKTVVQSLIIVIPLSIFISFLFIFFSKEILHFIGNSNDINISEAIKYQNITSLGMVFLGVNFVFSSSYRSISKTNIPMGVNLICLILNVILNYIFIFIIKWGVFGAGFATTISRLSVTIIYIYLTFFTEKYWIFLKRNNLKIDGLMIKRIIKVGIPAAVEQLALRFGMLIFEMMVISLGNINYAAHKIAGTAEAFSFNVGFAFSVAATTLVGQQLGKNSPKMAAKNGYACVILCVLIMSSVGFLFFLVPELMISLFTKELDVKKLASSALRVVSICQPFLAASIVFSGALRGAGDTKSVLLVTFLGIFLIRIPTTYFFLYILKTGLLGAWIVMTIDLAIRSLIGFYIFKKGKWKHLVV